MSNNHIVENPDRIKKADIVVGIPSYNEAQSIRHVVETVDDGLSTFFGKKDAVIINVDNHSPDNTKDVFLTTPTKLPKLYISTPKGIKAKAEISAICLRLEWNLVQLP